MKTLSIIISAYSEACTTQLILDKVPNGVPNRGIPKKVIIASGWSTHRGVKAAQGSRSGISVTAVANQYKRG
ncbi:MAG: hypothetical protein ABI599_03885 [Flavobacteriales bacterium]